MLVYLGIHQSDFAARRESWIDPGTRWDADGSRDNTWTRLDDFFTGTENWKWHSGGFERPVVDMCNARECTGLPACRVRLKNGAVAI